MPSLFDPLKVGDLTLKNRIFMAPLTRMRSQQPGNIPYELHAEYYSQRASAGLIFTEATQVSQQGQGYPGTPGIHSADQIEGWKKVTRAVHAKGGKIFLQLWHVGRISHSSHQPNGGVPVAPSAIAPKDKVFTAHWEEADYETPRALEVPEINGIVNDFAQGARNAKEAGFDGVEIHGANGYLPDQFLQDGTNKRTDIYGGPIENRARFLLEITDAVMSVWGKERVGVRLSPYGTFADISDSDPVRLFTHVVGQLSMREIAYLHVVEPRSSNVSYGDQIFESLPSTSEIFRPHFKGILFSAGGYTPQSAKETVENRRADAVAFGRSFIANPDLVERIRSGAELNRYDRSTFYGGKEKGYTDYPFMAEK